MKKVLIIIIFSILIIGGGIYLFVNSKSSKDTENNYKAERSSTSNNVENSNIVKKEEETNNIKEETTKVQEEKEIASFSTKIYNKDEERQNNITITCKALNGKEIKAGETFSFCNTVGKSTTTKGYQKADIYVDGKKKQGLGGGNCQVSTTLYNAVLKISELEIVERHQHSGKVPYIKNGQDAAVAYGTYDFKFKNNLKNNLKLIVENTTNNITAKIIEII